MSHELGPQTMVGRLELVAVKTPEAAAAHSPAEEWSALGWHGPLELERAAEEHQHLVSVLRSVGAEVIHYGPDERTGLDSMYAHDSALVTPAGVVPLRPGKPARSNEGAAVADALAAVGVPVLDGFADPAATAEGGDMTWLDPATLIIGRSFRTNDAGIAAVREIVEPMGAAVHAFDLPYWRGPAEVLHLMSFISMIDHDLALVHRPMLPVGLANLLTERGIDTVAIAAEEFLSQACNVLTLEPRHVVVLDGNPLTRKALEAVGCSVESVTGAEMSLKGDGGPTCLTRPLRRAT